MTMAIVAVAAIYLYNDIGKWFPNYMQYVIQLPLVDTFVVFVVVQAD